jgi:probable rRNA maturation factor
MITLDIRIDIADAGWKKLFPRLKPKVEQAAAAAFHAARKPKSFAGRRFEVSLILTDDKSIRRLNKDYRGFDKPTNVLSFPQMSFPKVPDSALKIFGARAIPLGDVVLARGVVQKEARLEKKTLEGHIIHLTIHGILHLLGYDHMRKKEAIYMEKLESDILTKMGYPDPYHESTSQHSKKKRSRNG